MFNAEQGCTNFEYFKNTLTKDAEMNDCVTHGDGRGNPVQFCICIFDACNTFS